MCLMMRTVYTCSVEDMGTGTTGIDCWCKAGRVATPFISVKTVEEREPRLSGPRQ